jgi:uncharacterized protein RhaS with RHS repeats
MTHAEIAFAVIVGIISALGVIASALIARRSNDAAAQLAAQGAPMEMTDSAGNKLELIRNPQRDLQEIRGSDGASIKLAYDDHDRVVRADNGHGAWTNYTYGSSGFLTDVAHSDGTARYYFYEGGELTFVRDEQKRLLIHNFYDNRSHWVDPTTIWKRRLDSVSLRSVTQWEVHRTNRNHFARWLGHTR